MQFLQRPPCIAPDRCCTAQLPERAAGEKGEGGVQASSQNADPSCEAPVDAAEGLVEARAEDSKTLRCSALLSPPLLLSSSRPSYGGAAS